MQTACVLIFCFTTEIAPWINLLYFSYCLSFLIYKNENVCYQSLYKAFKFIGITKELGKTTEQISSYLLVCFSLLLLH